jgi:hypothetical protein
MGIDAYGPLKPLENLESINVRGRNIKSIETIRSMPTLRRLSLKPKSCARDLAVLEGHQLDTLAVDVCKEADIGHISACDVGQFLGIRKWRWKDLTGLKVRAPDLTINGGSLVSTHGLASNGFDRVYFAQVQKLGSLVGLTARRIWVATCRNLMPEAFAEVRDLRWLYLSSQPEIRSFDFVARLPKLINLSIDATRISTKDLSALAEAGSLQRVWLPKQVGQEVIEAAAKANPRLSISNGVDYFVKGRRASAAGFEAERVELSKVLCQG